MWPSGTKVPPPALTKIVSSLPLSRLIWSYKRSRSAALDASACTAVTPPPISGCSFQSRLAASGDVNVGALCNEALGRSQADATGTARNKRNFVFEFLAHDVLLWSDARRTAVLAQTRPSQCRRTFCG